MVGEEVDLAEFLFITDPDVILYRELSRINTADPPGCLGFGCINGPRNRGRVEQFQKSLDFLTFETDEDKKWYVLVAVSPYLGYSSVSLHSRARFSIVRSETEE